MNYIERRHKSVSSRIIPVQPFDYVVFGATGDLTKRKLIPALYHRFMDGQFDEQSRIIGVSRTKWSDEDFRKAARDDIAQFVDEAYQDDKTIERFVSIFSYVPNDVTDPAKWGDLSGVLRDDPQIVRAFYMAIAPDLFGPTCEYIKTQGYYRRDARVVIEKPLGHDLDSSIEINDEVSRIFSEDQVYRIDHYLGKETVQNLLALRFANVLFEPVWNATHIDHVQITVAESVGAGTRGYYDESGALRDMVQNHMLQLLCLVAMEPPASDDSDALRDEKLKVLRSLKPIGGADVSKVTVRGQYRGGSVDGQAVASYQDELPEDKRGSKTETFVALKAEIENWRWAGVPFYIRTGKRLASRDARIEVNFRPTPHAIFRAPTGFANKLVINLQPKDGLELHLVAQSQSQRVSTQAGVRGGMAPLAPVQLNLDFDQRFGSERVGAYERLLLDVIEGRLNLFVRSDEQEEAWRWVEPLLDAWQTDNGPRPYAAGTWGPSASSAMIARDGNAWSEEQ